MLYEFDNFTMDLDRFEVRWRDQRLDLQPKVFAVLRVLLENASRTVPKHELMDTVWPDVVTGDESLMKAISQARRILADCEPDRQIIRTVRGRGYGIGVPVETVEAVESEPGEALPPSDPEPAAAAPRAPETTAGATPAVSPLAGLTGRTGTPSPAGPGGGRASAARPNRVHARSGRSLSRGLLVGSVAIGAAAAIAISLAALLAMPPDDLAPVTPAAPATATTAPASAVAVLPFADLSPDGDHTYLGHGLSEELIDSLAQRPELRVAARTSAFAFEDGATEIPEIGRQLGVGSIVEGSVRLAGDRLRVTAQLVRASDGFHVWSQTYDRPLADVLTVQDEIAEAIAGELQVRLLPAGRPPRKTRNVQAHLAYLRGVADLSQPTAERVERALESFQLAAELDPGFAEAHAGIADAYLSLWGSYSNEPRDGALMEQAEAAARRAMEADERSPYAHDVMARIECGRHRRWRDCLTTLQRGLALDPNSVTLLNSYASFMTKIGRFDEALSAIEHARAVDPLSPNALKMEGRIHLYAADYDRALALFRRAQELRPSDPDLPSLLSKAYGMKGMEDQSREAVLLIWSERSRPLVRIAAQALGTVRFLRGILWLAEKQTGNPCGHDAWAAAHVYAYTGETESMLECLERESLRHLWYIRVEPAFDPYRSDPRFVDLLERSGFGGRMVDSTFE